MLTSPNSYTKEMFVAIRINVIILLNFKKVEKAVDHGYLLHNV